MLHGTAPTRATARSARIARSVVAAARGRSAPRKSTGIAAVDEEAGARRRRRASAARRRRPRRPACRTRRPRARRDRTTRCATARCTRRRRGSSRRAASCGCGGDEPHACARAPSSSTSACSARELGLAVGAARAADDTSVARGSSSAASAADREVGALQRLDATDEQQRPAGGRGRARGGPRPRSPGREHAGGRRRAGRSRCARDRRRRADELRRAPRRSTRARGRRSARPRPRRGAAASTSSSRPASAFTRSSVWNVATSGRSSSCFSRWPTAPDTQ